LKQIVLIKIQIILQLLNGTIVTLTYWSRKLWYQMDDNGFDNRVTGSLCFWKGVEELKAPSFYDENQVFNRKWRLCN
jgi:hypothetical protein